MIFNPQNKHYLQSAGDLVPSLRQEHLLFAQRPLGEDGFQYFMPNLFKYKVKTIQPNSRGCSDGENTYRSGLCLGASPTDINNIKRIERARKKTAQMQVFHTGRANKPPRPRRLIELNEPQRSAGAKTDLCRNPNFSK